MKKKELKTKYTDKKFINNLILHQRKKDIIN